MPRPTNKVELLEAADNGFKKLFSLIGNMPPELRVATFAFEDRDRNVKDVLVHLYEWHRLLLRWAGENRAGRAAAFLPDPYTWKTYPQMNVEFWEKHRGTSLEQAEAQLKESHAEVMELIGSFSDEELFTKKYFTWTGTTNLGSYCISATSSHYDWAIKKLKEHVKTFA